MKSKLFDSGTFLGIQSEVRDLLNRQVSFLSKNTAKSPRAVGDAIEGILGESFQAIVGAHCAEYSSDFARRAMADLAFKDADDFYYVVDVKTHRSDTKFSMPNLISVERLARFYEDDKDYFTILMVSYTVEDLRVIVSGVQFAPIEFLDWNCLTVGALGWGQIQIANTHRITVNPGYSRRKWMIELCETMLEFYPREIVKIGDRIDRFEQVRDLWLARTEDEREQISWRPGW